MSLSFQTYLRIALAGLIALIVSIESTSAGAQGISPLSLAGLPFKAALWPLQSVLPMLASRASGGKLSGNTQYRYVFGYPSGAVINEDLGQSLDLVTDLGYPKQTGTFETSSRINVGRLSLRTYHFTPVKGLSSDLSRIDWPQWSFGADLDLMRSPSLRFGADVDYAHTMPKFSLGDSVIGSTAFELPKPITAGAHLELGTAGMSGFALSLEARWRTSVQESLDFSETNIALGLVTHMRAIGFVGLRGGYRHTKMEFRNDPYVLDFNVNSAFIELVCWY